MAALHLDLAVTLQHHPSHDLHRELADPKLLQGQHKMEVHLF